MTTKYMGRLGRFSLGYFSKGLTLVELLVVISLLAVLMGIGLFQIASLRRANQLKAEVLAFRSLLRMALGEAKRGKSAFLEILPKKRKVSLKSWQTLFYFPFEQEMWKQKGEEVEILSRGIVARSAWGKQVKLVEGLFGKGVKLGEVKSHLAISSPFSSKKPLLGFGLSLWVFVESSLTSPLEEVQKSYLAYQEQLFFLLLDEFRGISIGLWGREKRCLLRTAWGVFPKGKWFHLFFLFYRGEVQLFIDGIPCPLFSSGEPPRQLFGTSHPLLLGGGTLPFRLDEVTLEVPVTLESLSFSRLSSFEVEGAYPLGRKGWSVFFSPPGRLHPLYHFTPISFLFRGKKKGFRLWLDLSGFVKLEEVTSQSSRERPSISRPR